MTKAWLAFVAAVSLCALATRVLAGEEALKIPVDGRVMEATLFTPAVVPAPAVLVLHTKGGLQQADVDYARDLAGAGFVSLVVAYSNPALGGQLMHPSYVTDLSQVVDALAARPEVQGRPVGVVGFSLGSQKAVMLATRGTVKAVVGYYGPYDPARLPQNKGRRVPPGPVDMAAKVQAAVLLLHGEWDDETPIDQATSMRDALQHAGKTVELIVYPKAYHRFERGPAPGMRGERSREGYTYRLDEAAREDAWKRTLAWFRKYLAP